LTATHAAIVEHRLVRHAASTLAEHL
jgi:hypothetical protein